jgi:hypothetical protein
VLDAPGEEPLVADPLAERQGEPALPEKELLLAPEPVVDLADRGRRQFWDPSVSRQQADLPLMAVCPYARVDSGWLMYLRAHQGAAC